MKTLVLRTAALSVVVGLKVDIFATNNELQTAGFDTRFTNMDIDEGYNNAAKALFNIREIESGWQAIIALAKSVPGLGLYLLDINESAEAAIAQAENLTLSGTSGTMNVVVKGVNYLATFATNLTVTANNFVTAHAVALLAAGIVVTSPSAGVLRFTASVAGKEFSLTRALLTGNLNGVVTSFTLNQSTNGELTIVSPNHL